MAMARSGKLTEGSFLKVLLKGFEKSGKTQLFNRLVGRPFLEGYRPTVGIDFNYCMFSGGEDDKAQLWDTTGQERFDLLSKPYQRGVELVLFCFDPMDKESLQKAQAMYDSLSEKDPNGVNDDCQFVLVATKMDMVKSDTRTCVEDAKRFANSRGIGYVETSAKNGTGLDDVKGIFAETAERVKTAKLKVEPAFIQLEKIEKVVKFEIQRLREGARWYTRGQKAKANRIEVALHNLIRAVRTNPSNFLSKDEDMFLSYKLKLTDPSLKEALNSYRYLGFFNRARSTKQAEAYENVLRSLTTHQGSPSPSS